MSLIDPASWGTWIALLSLLAQAALADDYKKTAGPLTVQVLRQDWRDAKRDRAVPVKFYYPSGDGPFPVIIFSHGLGGSREGYEYLGRHWASYGYVCVHLQHLGSDTAAWLGQARPMDSMRVSAADVRNAINRPLDVSFAIDQLETMNKEPGPLQGKLNLDRLGVAGHSFGAYTTLAVAGQAFTIGKLERSLGDPRVKAAIAMSAPVGPARGQYDAAYGKIKIPILHMTGTRDTSPIGSNTPADRRIPFDHITAAPQYLVTFKDGDHMVFSGHSTLGRNRQQDEIFHQLILMSTTTFWDAYLLDDPKAKAWLADGAFAAALGDNGKFEKK